VPERVVELVAKRDIEVGEEIAVDLAGRAPPASARATVAVPHALRWGESPGRGRGVFTVEAIAAGDTIELAPVLVFPTEDWERIVKTILNSYCYLWGEDLQEGAAGLGYASLYNHSFSPNARYLRQVEMGVLQLIAVREIPPGDEILVNYNDDPEDKTPVWFEVVS
jgi:SET domain-containing protein